MANNIGFDLGVKLGNGLYKIFSPQNTGLVIAHKICKRRRYTCSVLKGQQDLCANVQKELNRIEGVTSAKVNPYTGSVTVSYTLLEKDADRLFDELSHLISGKHAQHEATLIVPSSMVAVSDNINDSVRSIRDNIRNFFNHTEPLFVSRLVGVAFIGYGVYSMIFRGDRPSATQVFFWGLGLVMRQSHKHS